MTEAIMASILLALLSAWVLAVCHDARRRHGGDPIGAILAAWLEPSARRAQPGGAGVCCDAASERDFRHIRPKGGLPLSHLDDTKFARPFVYATAPDILRLRSFVRARPRGGPGVDLLIEEIARMEAAPTASSETFVRLGSPVRYRDLRTRRERVVRVVAPHAADPEENRVSVLSPIGAALIGLCVGSIFRWLGPDGRSRAIKVLEVEP